MLKDQGLYYEVRPLYERALAIYQEALGQENPYTATVLGNLGVLLEEQGNYEEARRYLESALQVYERVYGEEHPYTAAAYDNLAGVLRKLGALGEARALHERALTTREKSLGEQRLFLRPEIDIPIVMSLHTPSLYEPLPSGEPPIVRPPERD